MLLCPKMTPFFRNMALTNGLRAWQLYPNGAEITRSASSTLRQHLHRGTESTCPNRRSEPPAQIESDPEALKLSAPVRPLFSSGFWSSREVWKRARVNTLRCLVGCTLGDFSTMWFLQTHYPHLGVGLTMGVSSKSAIETLSQMYCLCFALSLLDTLPF